jgi:exodeoxyribonuclease VII large subunit
MMKTVPRGVKIFTVSELTSAIEGKLMETFPSVWVSGEVSNVRRPTSGHLYFSLRDRDTVLGAVIYRSALWRIRFDLKDGMEVIVRGPINIYRPQGNYQLSVEELQPKGIGAQELALRQLKEKLFAKGYFDPRRKKKLPSYPRRVALITSATGAAVRDMLQVLTTRWTFCDVVVCPVRVQGDYAPGEIAAALALLNAVHARGRLQVDVIIIGRGGGSAEDLGVFNVELVADAIFASRIPVVSAVGHEIDVTIADMVADDRALTPTDAANRVTPEMRVFVQLLRDIQARMEDAVRGRIDVLRRQVDGLAARGPFRLPLARVRTLEERLDEISGRLQRAARQKLSRAGEALAAASGRLETLSPLNVLRRGYSVTRTEDTAELVRDATAVRPGDKLLTTLGSGEILSRVEEVRPAAS